MYNLHFSWLDVRNVQAHQRGENQIRLHVLSTSIKIESNYLLLVLRLASL